MNDRFLTTGKHGQWMMRNSASVQVNLDLVNKKDAEECGFIADCISPLAAILFSNAPFKNGRPIGYENIRYRIWEDTDPARCGHFLDHGILGADGLLNQFCHYILDVPVIYTTPDKNDNVGFYDGTIKQWLESTTENNELNSEDIKTALHQIFTHGRYKTVLEIRSTDRPPKGYEFAPIAFWQALMEQGKTRDILLGEISNWSLSERMELNLKASTLDINQLGPNNKTIFQWFEWLAELVYDSLNNGRLNWILNQKKNILNPFLKTYYPRVYLHYNLKNSLQKKEFLLKNLL
jgi:glutamate--cysteine ligase